MAQAARPANRPEKDAKTEGAPAREVREVVREVMDIRQAADYLGISADSLYRYASENTVPAFRLGHRWRFKKSRLDAWMDEQSGASGEAPKLVKPRQKKPVRAVGRA